MKILKIEDNKGFYLFEGSYHEVDKIDKEGLLTLVNQIVDDESVEMDDYDPEILKNQAHQVIYGSLFRKLNDLKSRRNEFVDASKRLFLREYRQYSGENPLPEEDHDVDVIEDIQDINGNSSTENEQPPEALDVNTAEKELSPEDLPF